MRIQVIALMTVAASAGAEIYEIRPAAENRVALEVFKTGFMSGKKHLFEFTKYAGTLNYDSAVPEQSKVDFTIESGSFVNKDTWLSQGQTKDVNDETAGKKVLDIAQYPQIRFSSTGVKPGSAGAFLVNGNLTIRDITRPVTVTVHSKPDSNGRLGFTGQAEVKLKDFGIKPPAAALGLVGTRNEMQLSFTLTAVKK